MTGADEELDALPFFSREDADAPHFHSRTWKQITLDCIVAVRLHLFIYLLFYIATLIYLKSHTDVSLSTIAFTQEKLSTTVHFFGLAEKSIYSGKPSDDIDNAWDDLLSGINIRVSRTELKKTNQTSVRFPRSQYYLGWLEVSHQLHCVKYLRQAVYRDHYFPDTPEKEEAHWFLHVDHCLELLRQAVMCHAETSLMTFEWDSQNIKPMLKLEGPQHVCIDWDELKQKMKSRLVSDQEMNSLMNPIFGDGE